MCLCVFICCVACAYIAYAYPLNHTHIFYFFMQQNRAFWLLSSFPRFIYYCCCFCFSIASIIYCVDIMLCQYYCLCCVFAYVMFHASMYFFHRLFLSFLFVSNIQTLLNIHELVDIWRLNALVYVLSLAFYYFLKKKNSIGYFTTNSNVLVCER